MVVGRPFVYVTYVSCKEPCSTAKGVTPEVCRHGQLICVFCKTFWEQPSQSEKSHSLSSRTLSRLGLDHSGAQQVCLFFLGPIFRGSLSVNQPTWEWPKGHPSQALRRLSMSKRDEDRASGGLWVRWFPILPKQRGPLQRNKESSKPGLGLGFLQGSSEEANGQMGKPFPSPPNQRAPTHQLEGSCG